MHPFYIPLDSQGRHNMKNSKHNVMLLSQKKYIGTCLYRNVPSIRDRVHRNENFVEINPV